MSETKTYPYFQFFTSRRPRLAVLPICLLTFIIATLLFHTIYWGGVPRAIEAIKSSVTSSVTSEVSPAKNSDDPPVIPPEEKQEQVDDHLNQEQNLPVSADDVVDQVDDDDKDQPDKPPDVLPVEADTDNEDERDVQPEVKAVDGEVDEDEVQLDDDDDDDEETHQDDDEDSDDVQVQTDDSVGPVIKNDDEEEEETEKTFEDQSGLHTPLCPRLVLVSAPRHGSTWFLDSVEKCRFLRVNKTTGQHHYVGGVFRETEIWHSHKGPVKHITADDAINYVLHNSTIKIFPKLDNKRNKVKYLLKNLVKYDVPIIVLTRKVTSTFSSLTEARRRKSWNKIPSSPGSHPIEIDEETRVFLEYKQEIEDFFGEMGAILNTLDTSNIDYMDYDEVKDLEFIHAKNSGCYVHNCNYIDDAELVRRNKRKKV